MTEEAAHSLNVKATGDHFRKLQKKADAALIALDNAVHAQQKFMAGK